MLVQIAKNTNYREDHKLHVTKYYNQGTIAAVMLYSYFDANWVDKFQLTRPFQKGEKKDKTNEFAVRILNI